MSDPAPSAGEARARLVAAAAAERAAPEPATALAVVYRAMPPEHVADEVERLLRAAFSRHSSARDSLKALIDAAEALDAIGLTQDGTRLRLVAAAALEGRTLGPTMRDLETLAMMAASAAAEDVDAAREAAEPVAEFLSSAVDAEGDTFVETFASAKRSEHAALGASLREGLLRDGRAVAVGRCRRCRDAVALAADLTCPSCGRRTKALDFVAPAEVEAARGFLRTR